MSIFPSQPHPHHHHPQTFQRYFTLEEAVAMLDDVKIWMHDARKALQEAQDSVVLFKRMLIIQKKSGKSPSQEELDLLKSKYQHFEETLHHWESYFAGKGILVKDFGKGLIDFPYHSKSLNEDLLLCWHLGEEGLFYFHELETGFRGRKPITLLPE